MEQTVVSSHEIKQAAVAYPIHPLLQERWSPRLCGHFSRAG